MELVGEAVDGRHPLELIDDLRPDVAVLDVWMPELTGTEVFRMLRSRAGRRTAVLLLSACDDAGLLTAAACRGVAGYVARTWSPLEIAAAVESAGRRARFGQGPAEVRASV